MVSKARTGAVTGTIVFVAGFCATGAMPAGAATITADPADAQIERSGITSHGVNHYGGGTVQNAGGSSLVVGNDWGDSQMSKAAVFPFQLPDLGAVADPFATAGFSIRVSYDGWFPNANFDLYGLPARPAATVLGSDYFYGGSDDTAGVTRLHDNFVPGWGDPGGAGTTRSTSSAALLDYLNAQYAGGAGAGKFVFLRINADTMPSSFKRFYVQSAETATVANAPTITYTTVPEPATATAVASVGLLCLGSRRRRRRS